MSVSVFVRLGVSAGLPLEFNTIDTIKNLFGKHGALYALFIREKQELHEHVIIDLSYYSLLL